MTIGEEHSEHVSLALLLQTDTTKSISLFRNSSMLLEVCLEISIPISAMTLMVKGLTCVGFAPALKTSYFSPYRCLSKPSAICDLAELCSHKKRTFILFIHKHLVGLLVRATSITV